MEQPESVEFVTEWIYAILKNITSPLLTLVDFAIYFLCGIYFFNDKLSISVYSHSCTRILLAWRLLLSLSKS